MDPFGVSVVSIALRTAVVYFAILLGLRVSGKREIGQFTPFDLVMILLIANAVQNAMVGPDTSLLGGLIAAAVLLLVNVVVSKASSRSARIRGLTLGVPRVLVSDGRPVEQNMRREGINQEELEAAIREHGISDLGRVSWRSWRWTAASAWCRRNPPCSAPGPGNTLATRASIRRDAPRRLVARRCRASVFGPAFLERS